VIDPFTLKIVAYLTEREVGWLELGARAEVLLDGHEQPLTGVVMFVGFEADPVNGKFKVEVHIDNSDLACRSGVVGRARVLKREHPGVLAIPRDAVLPSSKGPAVFVVEGEKAVQRLISLGPDQGLMVVARTGLQAGDLLVVRGQRELVDGAKVLVTERAAAPDGSDARDPAAVQRGASETRVRSTSESGS
jgi:hypothetical protein